MGYGHTCALLSDGNVSCWGLNDNGQLGIGSTVKIGTAPGQMGSSLTKVALAPGDIEGPKDSERHLSRAQHWDLIFIQSKHFL